MIFRKIKIFIQLYQFLLSFYRQIYYQLRFLYHQYIIFVTRSLLFFFSVILSFYLPLLRYVITKPDHFMINCYKQIIQLILMERKIERPSSIKKNKFKLSNMNFSNIQQHKELKDTNINFNFTEDFQKTLSTQMGMTQRTTSSYEKTLKISKQLKNESKIFSKQAENKKVQLNLTPIKYKSKELNKVIPAIKLSINDDSYFKWKRFDLVGNRYQLLEKLGRGNFGQVIKAMDIQKKQLVAIKILKNDKKFTSVAEQQINILILLRQNNKGSEKCIVKIKNFFNFKNHICIIFELLSINLLQFMESIHFQPISFEIIRKIAIQLFKTLGFLKENKIIHADIKPDNIVFRQLFKTGIKLIDFGTSILNNQKYFDYIMSRHYRAPEIILGHEFDESIDMWSVGCVLVEMYIGRPLFPGSFQKQQLYLLIQCLGCPPISFLNDCKRRGVYFSDNYQLNQSLIIKNSIRLPGSNPIDKIVSDKNFSDFIKKILTWESSKRLNPHQALLDPWILEGIPSQLLSEHIGTVKNQLNKIRDKLKSRNSSIYTNKSFKKTPKKSLDNIK